MTVPTRTPDRIVVVGVLNVTPDSFSDGGRYDRSRRRGRARASQMRATAPTSSTSAASRPVPARTRIDADEECRRVLPVLRELVGRRRAGLDRHLPRVGRRRRARRRRDAWSTTCPAASATRNGRGRARRRLPVDPDALARAQRDACSSCAHYDDVVRDVRDELRARVDAAVAGGVDRVGAGHRPRARLRQDRRAQLGAAARAAELRRARACRCWSASSRKSFLGTLLADADGKPRPVDEREDATTALTAYCALQGGVGGAGARGAAVGRRRAARSRRCSMADRIALTGLRVRGHHGVFDFERRDGQDFVVDVALELDTAPGRGVGRRRRHRRTTASSRRRWPRSSPASR